MVRHALTIQRGAPFHARAWPVLDEDTDAPLRDPSGVEVTARARAWPGASDVVTLPTSLVLLTVPGRYDDRPVVAAQLDALTAVQTASWPDLSGHVWELAVSGEPVVGGLLLTPWAVTRCP